MNTQKALNILFPAMVGILFFIVIGELLTAVFGDPYSDAYYYGNVVSVQSSYKDIPMFECSWCHRTKKLNRHHIIPQSADISKKDDFDNIIVLCRDCHFVLGHRCDWKHFNPDVVEICSIYTNRLISSEYNDIINATNNVTGD